MAQLRSYSDPSRQPSELGKTRFEYAWNWFDFHARQRVLMFNFFILTTGLLLNAYVTALKEDFEVIAVIVGLLGVIMSAGFFCLDCRNNRLVGMGEDVLEELETNSVFTTSYSYAQGEKSIQLGFRLRERMEPEGWPSKATKHKYWIRGLESIVLLVFLVAALVPLAAPDLVTHDDSQETSTNITDTVG